MVSHVPSPGKPSSSGQMGEAPPLHICYYSPAWESGVRPRLSGLLGLTSSPPSSIFTTSSSSGAEIYPDADPTAYGSDVKQPLSGLSESTSSYPGSIFTTPSGPNQGQCEAGVRSRLSGLSGPHQSSIITTPPRPYSGALRELFLVVIICFVRADLFSSE